MAAESWADLYDRASAYSVSIEAIRETLTERRTDE